MTNVSRGAETKGSRNTSDYTQPPLALSGDQTPSSENPVADGGPSNGARALVWIGLVALAIGTGLARGIESWTGPWTMVALIGAMVVVAAVLAVGVASGRHELVPLMIAVVVLLPSATRGVLAGIGYPGLESFSSADIQYLRAVEYLSGGGPLGAPDARLALYPTSFSALLAVSAASGLDAGTLLDWSWLVSLSVMAIGTFLFARELSGSPLVGGLATVVVASNPWFYAEPIYDGFSLVLLPLWSYLMVRRSRHSGGARVALASLLLLTVIISSHFFTSLFLVIVGFGVGASVGFMDSASDGPTARLAMALRSGLEACLLPMVAVTAWLIFVAVRYFQEGVDLVQGFLSALASTPFSPASIGTTPLDAWQLVVLGCALFAYAGFALATLWGSIRSRRPALVAAVALALVAAPLVLSALVTPMQFGGGTDLKEWKVRPLHGAFLLIAPAIAMGMLEVRRRLSGYRGTIVVFLAVAAILTNSISLWLIYGSPGGRVFSADAIPRTVEETSITPGEYAALGEFVRQSVSNDRYLLADWHQTQWMTGAGGLRQTPDYLAAPFVSPEAVTRALGDGTYEGIAVDRNLLRFPSIYTHEKATQIALDSLGHFGLNRVFDSGSQILYITPTSEP